MVTASGANTLAELTVGADGTTLVANSSASTGVSWAGPSVAAGKNAIINGAFDIWQRGTSGTIAAGSYVAADRWYTYRSVAGSTFSRQTASLTGFQYLGRIARDSGNTSTANISCGQSIESVNSIPFAGQTVTFSFWARAGANFSATSNILRVRFLSSTTTDQNIVLYGGTTVIDQNVTLTTSWQRFTYTASVGSTAVTLGNVFSYDPTGTAGANDYFEVTGVQAELGSVATAFSRAGGTLQGELAACQRYFQVISGGAGFTARSGSTTLADGCIALPSSMRSTPSAASTAVLKLDNAGVANYTQSAVASTVSSFSSTSPASYVNLALGNFSGLPSSGVLLVMRNDGGSIQLSSEL